MRVLISALVALFLIPSVASSQEAGHPSPLIRNGFSGDWINGPDCPPWGGAVYYFSDGRVKMVTDHPMAILRGAWRNNGDDFTTEAGITSVGGKDSPYDHIVMNGRISGDTMQARITWITVADGAKHAGGCTLRRTF